MADLQEVKSNVISHLGYDEPSQTLTVRFHHGGTYRYPGVPADLHKGLLGAESIGKHFHQFVRPHYTGSKVS